MRREGKEFPGGEWVKDLSWSLLWCEVQALAQELSHNGAGRGQKKKREEEISTIQLFPPFFKKFY